MPDQKDLMVEVIKPDGTKAEVSMRHLFGDVMVDKLLRAMGIDPGPDDDE
jgi:hypothetical protein